MGFVAVEAVKNPAIRIDAMVKSIGMNGFVIALTSCVTTPLCIGLIVLCARLRQGPSVKRYLGLNPMTPRTMLTWLAIVTLFAVASDFLTRLLGRQIVPEFMVHVYETASVAPLLWVALIAAAPLFEEVFFGDFFLRDFSIRNWVR